MKRFFRGETAVPPALTLNGAASVLSGHVRVGDAVTSIPDESPAPEPEEWIEGNSVRN